METPPTLQLEKYEGPLDLLLDLIRRQEINIFDIPIADITQQYNGALQRMKEMDVEIAGDFILLAATLVHIKSKLLLPRDPAAPDEGLEEDPRIDLVQRLLELEKFKNAAQMLREKQMVEQVSWSKPDLRTFAGEQGEMVVTLWDLVKAFQHALDHPPVEAVYDVAREEWTVAQMMEEIRTALGASQEAVPLVDLVGRFRTKRSLITLFLALLEMIRLEAIVAVQMELFGPILLRKHRLFDAVLTRQTAAGIDAYD